MAEENQIKIEIVLDDGSVQKGFAKIQSEGEKTSKGLGKAFSINSFTDLAFAVNAVSRAISGLSNIVTDSVKESMEGERVNLRLASAMMTIKGVTAESVESFKSFSSELSNLVAIDDDVINANAAVLASVGRLSGEGLERATKAALDLSAGLGISVEDAFRRVALAAQGNTTAFGKLGFEYEKGASDGQKFAATLDQINSRFQGLAQAQAGSTFQGAINGLSVAFGDLKQAFGDIITSSPALRELFNVIREALVSFTNQIATFSESGAFNSFIIGLSRFAEGVNTYLIMPLEVFYNVARSIFDGIVVVINGVVAATGKVASSFASLAERFGIDNELTRGMKTFGESSSEAFTDSINNAKSLKTVLETPFSDSLTPKLAEITTRLETAKPALDATASAIGQVGQEVKKTKDAIEDGILYNKEFTSTGEAISAAFSEVGGNMKAAAMEIGISAKSIAKSVIQGVGTAAGNAFAAFGKAIAEGTNALDAFVNSLLASLGQMAVQVGTQFILQGVAYSLAGLPNGPALIGAGAALATFGGALAALNGGGGGGVSTGSTAVSTGGGFDGGGFTPTDGTIANTTEERAPREGLVVNINGDILGDENSGKRLADLLNAAFDAGGVTLRQGIA